MIPFKTALNNFKADEIGPKFDGTIGHSEAIGFVVLINYDTRLKTEQCQGLDRKDGVYLKEYSLSGNDLNLLKVGLIPTGYYNSKKAKQSFYLFHVPVRMTKHGLDFNRNSGFRSAFWNSLSNGLMAEFNNSVKRVNTDLLTNINPILDILNNHFFPKNFNAAFDMLEACEQYSIAINSDWELTYHASIDGVVVNYREIFIGIANPDKKAVEVCNPLYAQELQDMLNRNKTGWSLVERR